VISFGYVYLLMQCEYSFSGSTFDDRYETWIEDKDEEPLTPEQFKERMVLDSVSIDSDGDVSFYHSDGDLFWGHCILVTMNSENNFTIADIAG
jgi:hypothetical protein